MRRRAAGRADGRRWTSSLLVLGTAVLLGGALPAAPAQAAPAEDDRPVQITVDRLEPRTVTPGAAIEVAGTLVNDSADTYRGLSVRVQRGAVLRTRERLADDLDDGSDATAVTTPFVQVPGELEPGASMSFSYTTTADALRLTADGVYPLLVNLNGSQAGGEPERVGQLSTHLVVGQPVPAARTTVAWLWPIADRPHRDATGAFTDDDLAGEAADGGRLDRAVEVLEQLPRTAADGGGQGPPAVPVTLAVDPALLEELSLMAAGPYRVGDEDGRGTADAADLLERLRRVAGEHPVVALPYADVDADALVSVGQPAVVTRSLPGTGAAVIRDAIGVTPRTDLAWLPGPTVAAATLDTMQAGGVGTVVLPDTALTAGEDAVGADGRPAAARGVLPAAAGDLGTLVADSRLTDAVAGATPESGAGRLAEQRYLAELGALTSQLAAGDAAAPQTVLVAPPRAVDPDPVAVAAMMADTAGQPWLAPAALASLADGPQTDVGELVPGEPGLPAGGMAEIAETAQVRDDFAAAVAGDPATALAGYDAAIARAASAQWRGDPAGFAASAADLRGTVARLRERVTLLSPVNGTYSLASSDAPLVLTVRNDLPFAVRVRLDLRARGNVGLSTDDIGVTTLEPSSRTTLQVPTHVEQSGGFAVTARLTSPGGSPLGEAVQLQVKSTAYGSITLAITIGAAALLGLLFLRRAVRFVLQRRRGEPADDPAASAGVGAVPPTRSPV